MILATYSSEIDRCTAIKSAITCIPPFKREIENGFIQTSSRIVTQWTIYGEVVLLAVNGIVSLYKVIKASCDNETGTGGSDAITVLSPSVFVAYYTKDNLYLHHKK